MHELVVISGKGGTGKTSLVASLAVLADDAVLADCDVDAADLHLVLEPTTRSQEDFVGGSEAKIHPDRCTGCGTCATHCRFGAIAFDGDGSYNVDALACEGCGLCARVCEAEAITVDPVVGGTLFVADCRGGPMVHARLGVGGENSGKLVALVRTRARALAEELGAKCIIADGPPGIGCPVIASLGGASQVLIVTEPTLSGVHDLKRVLQLTHHFDLPAAVCINKWDLNAGVADEIEAIARAERAPLAGRIRYDRSVTAAQIARQAVVEHGGGAAEDVRRLAEQLEILGGERV